MYWEVCFWIVLLSAKSITRALIAFYHQVDVPDFPATDWAAIQGKRLTGTATAGIAVIAGILYQCNPILYMSLSGSVTVLYEILIDFPRALKFFAERALLCTFHNITSI
mgnify:CR=1 FL=1